MKLAVFCTVAISAAGLTAMLIQGCKREQSGENTPDTSVAAIDTNNFPPIETTPVVMAPSNPPVETSTVPQMPPPLSVAPATPETTPVIETPAPATTEYVVVQGDTLGKIAKNHGVSLRALEAANPSVEPRRLKIGQQLTIPAATANSAASPTTSAAPSNGEEIYVVKSGDTLTRIARRYGTTVKAIQEANSLTTTRIIVGRKLRIPVKTETPSPSVTTPLPSTTSAAPAATPDDQSFGQ